MTLDPSISGVPLKDQNKVSPRLIELATIKPQDVGMTDILAIVPFEVRGLRQVPVLEHDRLTIVIVHQLDEKRLVGADLLRGNVNVALGDIGVPRWRWSRRVCVMRFAEAQRIINIAHPQNKKPAPRTSRQLIRLGGSVAPL